MYTMLLIFTNQLDTLNFKYTYLISEFFCSINLDTLIYDRRNFQFKPTDMRCAIVLRGFSSSSSLFFERIVFFYKIYPKIS